MRTLVIIFLIILSPICHGRLLRVGVIDTGVNEETKKYLCKEGFFDFTGEGQNDTVGHGSNIVALIKKHAKNSPFCIVMLKFFKTRTFVELNSGINLTAEYFQDALKKASKIKLDVLNISAGGFEYSKSEKNLLKKILKKDTIIVTASGNYSQNLDINGLCYFYPACYKKDKDLSSMIVVGCKTCPKIEIMVQNLEKTNTDFKDAVDLYVDGNKQKGGGYIMSGSSQSTAIVTGKLVYKLSQKMEK